jgi:soluble lytic murein transglycosylase
VRRNWFSQREADDGCTWPPSRWSGQAASHRNDAWRKARLAMEANRPRPRAAHRDRRARRAAAAQRAERQPEPSSWPASTSRPRKSRKRAGRAGADQAGHRRPREAAFQLDNKWGPQLNAEERNWIWGVIGRQAAQRWGRLATHCSYFAKVTKRHRPHRRHAGLEGARRLRAGQWKQVLAAINAMSEDARKDPTWVYWKARALLATAPPERSRSRHHARARPSPGAEAAAGDRRRCAASTSMLALEELGQKITVPAKPAPLTPEEKASRALNPGLNRALYAIALGLRPKARASGTTAPTCTSAAAWTTANCWPPPQFACDREVWDRCINTSERTKGEIDVDQRFPMPFRDTVVRKRAARSTWTRPTSTA